MQFKPLQAFIKAIIFTVPVMIALYAQESFAHSKREIEIKLLRQEAHEIVSEATVNQRSAFLITAANNGVMITAAKYSTDTIDDMVILMEALGVYGTELLPEDHPAAIPQDLREYAQGKFIQSLDQLDKIGHYPELYMLSGIKFTNTKGKAEQFFVQTSVLAGGTSLFMANYSAENIELMGQLMRAIGWRDVSLHPVTQQPRVPAHLSNDFMKMLEASSISIEGTDSLRTILVSPDYLSAQGV